MTAFHDVGYLELTKEVNNTGANKGDRTGTGTKSLFSRSLRFDLSDGSLPLLQAKSTPLRIIAEELFWFLRGNTNIRPLILKGVNIWNEWPYKAYLKKMGILVPDSGSEEWKTGLKDFIEQIKSDEEFANNHGELGPVYGSQWTKWATYESCGFGSDGLVIYKKTNPINQINRLIESIKNNPDSRSHIVTAWNPAEYDWLRANSLPPCHMMFQCYVANGRLSLDLIQRSCDTFLGVPFNIASYSLLLIMLAHVTGLEVGEFIWNGKDVHLYNNHMEQVTEMLSRDLRPSPSIEIVGKYSSITDFTLESFKLTGNNPHPHIPAPVAV